MASAGSFGIRADSVPGVEAPEQISLELGVGSEWGSIWWAGFGYGPEELRLRGPSVMYPSSTTCALSHVQILRLDLGSPIKKALSASCFFLSYWQLSFCCKKPLTFVLMPFSSDSSCSF